MTSAGEDDPGEVLQDPESIAQPVPGLYDIRQQPPPHIDGVRQELARIVVIALVSLYAFVVVVGVFVDLAPERFVGLIAGLAGLSSLASAVVGFYFGSRQND